MQGMRVDCTLYREQEGANRVFKAFWDKVKAAIKDPSFAKST